MSTWFKHGEHKRTALLAGVLPRQGVHYLSGPQGAGKTTILADLVVALAAGDAGCGLGPTPGGMLGSLGGWFGHNVGAESRVAVVTSAEHLGALRASIDAAALARGVKGPLPILCSAPRGSLVSAVQNAEIRWHNAREELGGLDLIVIDDATFGEPHEHYKLTKALLSIIGHFPCPVLVAVRELPQAAFDLAGAVLETNKDASGGVLTLAKGGEGWSRRFSFESIRLGGVETRVVKPGAPTEFLPFHTAPAPAPEPVPEPEVLIVSRLVYPIMAGDPTDAEKERWPGYDGWVANHGEIIAAVERNRTRGRTEITVAPDFRGGTVRADVARVQTVLQSAGLAEFAIVIASQQQLLPQY